MAIPFWQPGELYQPGDIVQPTSAGATSSSALTNADFELGNQDWTPVDFGSSFAEIREEGNAGGGGSPQFDDGDDAFTGSWRLVCGDARASGDSQFPYVLNDARISITPGSVVSAACRVFCFGAPSETRAGIAIHWFNSSGTEISVSRMAEDTTNVGGFGKVEPQGLYAERGGGLIGLAADNFWASIGVTGVAPADAATFTVGAVLGWHGGAGRWLFDTFTVNFAGQEAANPFLFRAVQADAGFSGNSEPVWPTTLGVQVVDNEVTWEAVSADNVVWEAHRILVSGATEPTFPTGDGAEVADNTISWALDPRRVTDTKAPQSKAVAIAASKVFAGDDDIVPFSATVNALDWSSADDAGYLPTGLQSFGSNPVAALGLYRSNLVVFNAEGFQMWQVDEDPQNMALLDAGPVGSTYHRAIQPVSNDLVFLTDVGIRNIGIAGASTNLQAGDFGKAIDDLVKPAIAALTTDEDPIGLYYPGAGQYWLIFGDEAFVLTMNGGKSDMSWSLYTFPSAITDWTILGDDLYLRSGDKIWRFTDETTLDDDDGAGSGVEFLGSVWWHYLDFGAMGVTKQLIGFDVVADGDYSVSIGYNQKDTSQATTAYDISGDTTVGDIIPLPVSAPSLQLRLEFAGDQEWKWSAASFYLQDFRSTS